MAYDILSARYVNLERTAVVIMTADEGAVAISERDRPVLWQKLTEWAVGPNRIDPYIPAPAEPRRDSLSELDALKALLVSKGVLQPGDLPILGLKANER